MSGIVCMENEQRPTSVLFASFQCLVNKKQYLYLLGRSKCCSREAYATSLPNNLGIYSQSFDFISIKLQLNFMDSGRKE